MNELFFINAYRQGKTWLFDEVKRGLIAEPFVAGASELIQKYLDRKENKSVQNVPIIFSLNPFIGAEVVLECVAKCHPVVASKENSNIYEEDTSLPPTSGYYKDQEGDLCWLCPAQIRFFGSVADRIYAKIG